MANDSIVLAEGDEFELVPEQEPQPEAAPPQALAPPAGKAVLDDADAAAKILGEMMRKSPAFKAYVAKRVSASKPVLQTTPLNRSLNRAWQVSFGFEEIPSGSVRMLVGRPGCFFRGEKLMATGDDLTDLFVTGLYVGQKSQLRGDRIPASAFALASLGSELRLDTCESGLDISIAIENRSDTPRKVGFIMFGRAVV